MNAKPLSQAPAGAPTFLAITQAINARIAARSGDAYRFGIWNATNAGWGRGANQATLHRHSESSPLHLRLERAGILLSAESFHGDLNYAALVRRGDQIAQHLDGNATFAAGGGSGGAA